jgi:hypothetical protein
MFTTPQMHTDVARFVHTDRLREAERDAQVAAALAREESVDDDVKRAPSRLGALVPTPHLSMKLARRKPNPVNGVA